MGAIQSSINQMLGTAAASAFAIGHAKKEAEDAAFKASIEKSDLQEETVGLKEDIQKQKWKIEDLNQEMGSLQEDWTPENRLRSVLVQGDIEKANQALKFLKQKMAAKKAMKLRLEETIKRANKWNLGGKK